MYLQDCNVHCWVVESYQEKVTSVTREFVRPDLSSSMSVSFCYFCHSYHVTGFIFQLVHIWFVDDLVIRLDQYICLRQSSVFVWHCFVFCHSCYWSRMRVIFHVMCLQGRAAVVSMLHWNLDILVAVQLSSSPSPVSMRRIWKSRVFYLLRFQTPQIMTRYSPLIRYLYLIWKILHLERFVFLIMWNGLIRKHKMF